MILAIVAAIACFAGGIICFSPYFRKVPLLRPLAIFLIFQGVCFVVSFIFSEINPVSPFPNIFNAIGSIIILVYFIFILLMTRTKSKKKYEKSEK